MSKIGIEWFYRLVREPKTSLETIFVGGVFPSSGLILLQRLGYLPTVKNSSFESTKANTQRNKDLAFKFKIILQFLSHLTRITIILLWLAQHPLQFPKIFDSKDLAFQFKIIHQFLSHSATVTLILLWLAQNSGAISKDF